MPSASAFNLPARLLLNRRTILALALLALLLFAYLSLFKDALIDDAFITFTYARTLRDSGTWGMFPGHTANAATSPLNVVLLALLSLLTSSVVDAAILLTVLLLVLLAFLLTRIGGALRLPLFAPLALVALLCNPLLMSTLGLESILLTTLWVASLACYVHKRWTLLAVTCALATLARPDAILFFLIVLAALPTLKLRARTLVLFLLFLAPWYLYSWIVLGSALPDTFFLKLGTAWGSATFTNSFGLYFRRYPLELILSLAFLPFALLAFLKPVRAHGAIVYIIAAGGILHFVAYSLLRLPPYHWYYIPEIVTIILLGALSLSVFAARPLTAPQRQIVHASVALAFIIPLAGMTFLLVRGGGVLQEALIHTNWATPARYREVGVWLAANHSRETIPLRGEVGTLAYYCNCSLLDAFGDRSWLTTTVQQKTARNGIKNLLMRANFFFYRPSAPFAPGPYTLVGIDLPAQANNPTRVVWQTSSHWRRTGQITLFRSQ